MNVRRDKKGRVVEEGKNGGEKERRGQWQWRGKEKEQLEAKWHGENKKGVRGKMGKKIQNYVI